MKWITCCLVTVLCLQSVRCSPLESEAKADEGNGSADAAVGQAILPSSEAGADLKRRIEAIAGELEQLVKSLAEQEGSADPYVQKLERQVDLFENAAGLMDEVVQTNDLTAEQLEKRAAEEEEGEIKVEVEIEEKDEEENEESAGRSDNNEVLEREKRDIDSNEISDEADPSLELAAPKRGRKNNGKSGRKGAASKKRSGSNKNKGRKKASPAKKSTSSAKKSSSSSSTHRKKTTAYLKKSDLKHICPTTSSSSRKGSKKSGQSKKGGKKSAGKNKSGHRMLGEEEQGEAAAAIANPSPGSTASATTAPVPAPGVVTGVESIKQLQQALQRFL